MWTGTWGRSPQQCRRQSNQSEGALAENGGGTLKYTEIFHVKTDILRLQIMRYFNNFVFISEKQDVLCRYRFLNGFVSGLNNRLKNLSSTVNATRSATRILLGVRGLESEVNFFLH